MQNFNIIRQIIPGNSFRSQAVIGQFDLSVNNYTEVFEGSLDLPLEWSVGVIVGHSGTGKSTIARELFPNDYVMSFSYTASNVIDDMPEGQTVKEITKMFNSVGFSSPPSWLKPYNVLSNGEKMRVDLARALLQDKEIIVFDEFTSVVDRDVAKISSLAVQKAVRKNRKKFVAVTCHEDIVEWLQPDWVFDTNIMECKKKSSLDRQLNLVSTEQTKNCGECLESIII